MLDRLEKKFGRFAIKNLSYYIMFIYLFGSLIGIFLPQIYANYLSLNFDAIRHGQIWRLLTFILYPQITSLNLVNIFLGVISMVFYYYIGNTLERVWGAFRFNIYFLSGIILNIIGMFIIYLVTGQSINFGMTYVQNAMFLAFATLAPDTTIRLYFVIPIKIKYIGYIYGFILGWQIASNLIGFTIHGIAVAVAIVVSVLNFIVYSLSSKKVRNTPISRNSKTMKMINKTQPVHKCVICGKTNTRYPNLEFRYCSKCSNSKEYCEDHIFKHEHK